MTNRDEPEWEPLERLIGMRLSDWFMWMGEVELEDGTLVQMYKHQWTRRYIHLSEDHRAFWYRSPDGYEEAPLNDVVGCSFIGQYPGVDQAFEELDARLEVRGR
jgi:hypothetical protein